MEDIVSEELKVAGEEQHYISVSVSNDYYEAYISIDINPEAHSLTANTIKEELAKKNVTFGLETHTIDNIVSKQESVDEVLIAKGVRHKNGIDGEITYHFDVSNDHKPSINEDGTVDFKDMNFLQMVEEGQVLATRTMPTDGVNGTTVTGRVFPAKNGKVVNFKIGNNVLVSEDGLSISAEYKGNIDFQNDKVSVIKVLQINEDVGISTGNIEFSGDIIVNGSVNSGFSVKSTEGNVVINGIVDGAIIEADGDLTINGGIQGQNEADIKVGGDLVVKFINEAKVYCRGTISADAIMHSTVICDNAIILNGKRGSLIGGEVYARFALQAKAIGTEMGTLTHVSLGSNEEMLEAYHQVEAKMDEINANLAKLRQVMTMLRKKYEMTASPDDKLVLDKTEISSTEYAAELEKTKAEMRGHFELMEATKKAKIVADTIFVGAVIKISGSYYNVKTSMKAVRLVKENGEVRLKAV